MIPMLNDRVGVKSLGRLWLIVFLGNILGGTLFAILLRWIGPKRELISPEAFTEFAHLLTSPKWHVILGSATLVGWMTGLLGWLMCASHETMISKIRGLLFEIEKIIETEMIPVYLISQQKLASDQPFHLIQKY